MIGASLGEDIIRHEVKIYVVCYRFVVEFWWILEAKLAPKIDQKSIQKGIEKMIEKKGVLEADWRTARRNAQSAGWR